jgi:hypothetical protein
MKRPLLSLLALAASGLWFAACDADKVTGTADETNASAARLVDTAGSPVAGANLLVFRPQDTTGTPITTGVTKTDGSYSLPTVADGMYRVLARVASGKIAVQDSVYTNQGKLQVRTDTVRTPGSLSGVVRMIGDDNPQSVEVSVLGSDVSVVSVKADGTYRMEGLGAGTWKLKFSTSLPNYANTYVTAKSKATVGVKVDTVELNYVGIPPVKNLTAIMDYPGNGLKLVWTVPAGAPPVRDFLVQSATGSENPRDRGAVDSSGFVDNFWRDYDPRTVLYYVRIRTMDGSLGRVAYLQVKYDNPKKDSLLGVDSLLRLDSAAQWNRYFDSLARRDSLRRVDSLANWNSVMDSARRLDSSWRADSAIRWNRILDSIRVADSIRASQGSGDTTYRDSGALSQHARDSIARRRTLDSLNSLIAEYTWLLRDSAKILRDSLGYDTAALRQSIQKAQHQYDSLLAAPLAWGTGANRTDLLAARIHEVRHRRQDLSLRREEIWAREDDAAAASA